MKKIHFITLIAFVLTMTGCQSLGEHFNCIAEVDRTIPPKTQQKYVRTDTKCTSSGSGIATPTTTRGDQYIVNTDKQTNCTSTPVYETVVLNQLQRDAAYQQCRGRAGNQRAVQQYQNTPSQNCVSKKTDAEYNACIRGL